MAKEEAVNLRTAILNKAIQHLGNRGLQHGEASVNMAHTAALWNAFLGIDTISASDVALMMVLHKFSRIKAGDAKHPDHYEDSCGYTAIAGEIAMK